MRKALLFLMVFTLGAGVAVAQETTGAIMGQVTSEDAATLPGVTVTINDSETGLRQVRVTGVAGDFKFVALPPARYDLEAALDGFQTYKRVIEVGLGRTVKNDFVMQLGAVTDVIEVTGEAPLVDVTSTVSGLTVSASDLDNTVPIVHDTQRIALLAPSTTMGDTAFNGSDDGMYDQKLVSVGGASVAENAYHINGLDLTNFRTGVGSSWVPMEFVDEIQVKTGGYEAEFGRSTGGVVNMVTKSGSNSFRGGASLFYEPESLQEYEPDTPYAYNQQEEREVLEANASIGGRIIRDKLFFFGFIQYRDTDYLKNTTTTAQRELGEAPYYGGKLDWNITPSHRLEATYLTDETEIDIALHGIDADRVIGSELLSESTTTRGGENYIGKYTGIFTENFLLSAQWGMNDFDRTDAGSGDAFVYAWDFTTGTQTRIGRWGTWNRGSNWDEREAYRIDADVFAGNHSLRGGYDFQENFSDALNEYSGGARFDYHLAGDKYPGLDPDQMVTQTRYYGVGGSFFTESTGLYIQDSWAATPNLTVNLGVRWEQYENFNNDGEKFIDIDDQYAPRIGVIWDPSGQGQSKVYGSYGKYHLPIASNTNIRLSGAERYQLWWRTVDGYNPDGSPINLGTVDLEPMVQYSDGTPPDPLSCADENIEPMAQDELIIGYERMFGNNWSVGARGVMRQFGSVIEDIGIDEAVYNHMGVEISWWGALANPGSGFSAWRDLDGDGVLDRVEFSAEQMGYPEAERNYYAVELTAKKRFSDNWMLDLAYTWSQSYGNYEGYVDSTIGQSDGGITQLFDYIGLMDHSYGPLPNDRRHNLKAFGVYSFDMGLQIGGTFFYQSGRPLSGQGVHPTDDWAASYHVASFYVQGEPAPRGSFGTTGDAWGLDAMIKYDFTAGPVNMFIRADVFNLFNNDTETEVDEEGDLDSGLPNAEFLVATHYQPPRGVRFGFGITF